MNVVSIIEDKRDGKTLEPARLQEFITECADGNIPDYQLAAWLMAVYFRGMSVEETRALTLAMRDSGEVLVFPPDARPLVDKHSTGGVGDKVSLPLAPLLACLGFRVPMISGRGLGITGGTLDKLESIPGYCTVLSHRRIVELVQCNGCVITGQTAQMVPADEILYALRDVTGTVPSIPLITGSILSKKLAEGLDALVLDVKFGAAAFMPELSQARTLARAMVTLGTECGLKLRALLTNMGRPLGRAAGNWLEVREAVDCLEGRGPADLQELVIDFAAHLLEQTGRATSLAAGRKQARECLASGQPRAKWNIMLAAQGTDLDAFHEKLRYDHTAPVVMELPTSAEGIVAHCDARIIGEVVRDLGGGRLKQNSIVQPEVGVDMLAALGEKVTRGSVICRVHANDKVQAEAAARRLQSAFKISDEPPPPSPLIAEIVRG